MDIQLVNKVDAVDISKSLFNQEPEETKSKNTAFETLFQSMLSMVNETNDYIHKAGEAEISYMLGELDNPIALQAAQNKASVSLQYTVAVRNAVISAYKEIMQMQF